MLCRICVREVDMFRTLYDLYYGNVPARLFIEDILKIDISNNQQTIDSQYVICFTCNKILNDFHKFLQTVKEAQRIYQQINNRNLEIVGRDTESVDISHIVNEMHVKIEDCVEVNNSNDIEYNTSNVTKYLNLEQNVHSKFVDNFLFENRTELFVERSNNFIKSINDLTNAIGKSSSGSQLERENYRFASKEKIECRIENATNKMLAKYKKEEIFYDGEWLLSDVQKDEMLSLYVEVKCYDCNVSNFPNYKALSEHAAKNHGIIPMIICCDSYTSNIENLQLHILYKHILKTEPPRKPIYSECPVCHKSIEERARIGHISSHVPPNKRDFPCDQCGSGFHTKGSLEGHIKRMHTISEVTCDECGKIFRNKYILKYHKKNVHELTDKHFTVCSECGKKVSRFNLRCHMKTHQEVKKGRTCHICNSVVKEERFKDHVLRHDEKNKKQCPHCPHKAFKITQHIKIVHEKVKPFACSMCPMKVRTEIALKNHMASRHTGVPQYSCEFCGRTFMSNGNYYAHRKRMHPVEVAQQKEARSEVVDTTPVEKTKRILYIPDAKIDSLKEAVNKSRKIKPKK